MGIDDRDEPIAELRELRVETSREFTNRVRRRIERKEVTNHFLWALWYLPATVLVEFLGIAFGLANSNRGGGGGKP